MRYRYLLKRLVDFAEWRGLTVYRFHNGNREYNGIRQVDGYYGSSIHRNL